MITMAMNTGHATDCQFASTWSFVARMEYILTAHTV
jgi:hypothetical protein